MTPHRIVARYRKLAVRAYAPVARRYATPVVLVPALISRATILDLYDGGSVAQYLAESGFSVYLLDWGVPGDEDRDLGLDDLVLEYLPWGLDRVRRRERSEGISLLGYCMGGTLAAVYAALARWSAPNNLIALAAPVDFAHGGRLAEWCSPDVLDIDRVVEIFGNVPAVMVEGAFAMLRPTAKVRAALRFFEHAGDPRAHDAYAALARWSDDWIPFPGRAARDWVKLFYQQNLLVRGTLRLRERRVDLARIEAPLLAIAAREDEIAPAASVAPLVALARSVDRELLELPGGHIGLVAGRAARDVLWPRLEQWLAPRSGELSGS